MVIPDVEEDERHEAGAGLRDVAAIVTVSDELVIRKILGVKLDGGAWLAQLLIDPVGVHLLCDFQVSKVTDKLVDLRLKLLILVLILERRIKRIGKHLVVGKGSRALVATGLAELLLGIPYGEGEDIIPRVQWFKVNTPQIRHSGPTLRPPTSVLWLVARSMPPPALPPH